MLSKNKGPCLFTISRSFALCLCILIGGLSSGCIASSAFTRAEVVEWRDENPDHRPYPLNERRQVVVTGDRASQIANLFPELGIKPAEEDYPDNNPRFEILLTRANGQQYRLEVQSTNPDNPCWYDATAHATHVLNLAAVPILNDLMRTAPQNPFVEAQIIQIKDDSNRLYESPIRYVAFRPEEIVRLFPELKLQRKVEPKGDAMPEFSIIVELYYANGDRAEILVGLTEWTLQMPSGGATRYALHPSAAKELRERLSTVGRLRTLPTSKPQAVTN